MLTHETTRDHEHAPRSVITKDASNFALKCRRTAAKLRPKLAGKRPKALVAHFEADFRDCSIRGQHLSRTCHAQPREEIVRGFAEGSAEKPMEMKLRETCRAGCLRE